MAKLGRKHKLTPETSARICEGVRLRMSNKCAAVRGGIDEVTFYRWLSEGEAADRELEDNPKAKLTPRAQRCRKFRQDIMRAQSDGQAALLALVHQGARDDWRAASWILERRHPQSFSKRHYQALQENKDESITVVFHRPTMNDGKEPESDNIGTGADHDLPESSGNGE